jgi:hypothetical protein
VLRLHGCARVVALSATPHVHCSRLTGCGTWFGEHNARPWIAGAFRLVLGFASSIRILDFSPITGKPNFIGKEITEFRVLQCDCDHDFFTSPTSEHTLHRTISMS